MSKLSTGALRERMVEWLRDPRLRDHIRYLSDPTPRDGGEPLRDLLDRTARGFGLPAGLTSSELEDGIWSAWCDARRWKRAAKQRLGESYDDYFYRAADGTTTFSVDVAGGHDDRLVAAMVDDPALAKRCTCRIFVPDEPLSDSYRLEVVTTPDEEAVVGWTFIVD